MKAKWIGGILGFMASGPLGALAGFAMGALFDTALSLGDDRNPENNQNSANARQYARQSTEQQGQQYSFRFSLLVLASYIIQADGKVMHSEMEYVRGFLRQVFGADAEQEGNEILLRLFERRKQMEKEGPYAYSDTIHQCAAQVGAALPYEQRVQLLAFLCGIAKADGRVCNEEIQALYEVADYMGLRNAEVDSLLNLGGSTLDEAYKVLGVSPDASYQEVQSAYRRLTLIHHPDKVEDLGEDVKQAAQEKMQQINRAMEMIKKARGK